MNTRRLLSGFVSLAVIAVLASCSPRVLAQDTGTTDINISDSSAAGVVITPDGVLRMQVMRDPTGVLIRQRIAQARAELAPDVARRSPLRKISLNRLEAALAANFAAGGGLTEDMRYLAGLTRLEYVFFYPETGDIVVAGPAEGYMLDLTGRPIGIHSGRAVLELQDLVVALRAFAPGGDPTRTIGCSIDPTQEGLARMQQYLQNVAGRITPNDAQQLAIGLRDSLGQQEVTINGVSDTSHFAQVLVEADYRMKLIGIGLERPPVRITSYIDRARPSQVARNAMQRWYFVPNYECVCVSDDMLSMQLQGDGVQLVGENEMVRGDGSRVQGQGRNAASEAFTESFTSHYGALADRVPVYAQLRNLVDMSIAAAYIQDQDFYGQANWNMELLGNEELFSVETYRVPERVESAVNVVWKGNTLMTPIGGGVHIEPTEAISPGNLIEDEEGAVNQTRSETSLDGLAEGQWWWD